MISLKWPCQKIDSTANKYGRLSIVTDDDGRIVEMSCVSPGSQLGWQLSKHTRVGNKWLPREILLVRTTGRMQEVESYELLYDINKPSVAVLTLDPTEGVAFRDATSRGTLRFTPIEPASTNGAVVAAANDDKQVRLSGEGFWWWSRCEWWDGPTGTYVVECPCGNQANYQWIWNPGEPGGMCTWDDYFSNPSCGHVQSSYTCTGSWRWLLHHHHCVRYWQDPKLPACNYADEMVEMDSACWNYPPEWPVSQCSPPWNCYIDTLGFTELYEWNVCEVEYE